MTSQSNADKIVDDRKLLSYMMLATGTNLVKIGKSIDPVQRLRGLTAGTPFPLELIATFDIPETDLHKAFCESRVKGEWYEISDKMILWLQQTGHLVPAQRLSNVMEQSDVGSNELRFDMSVEAIKMATTVFKAVNSSTEPLSTLPSTALEKWIQQEPSSLPKLLDCSCKLIELSNRGLIGPPGFTSWNSIQSYVDFYDSIMR